MESIMQVVLRDEGFDRFSEFAVADHREVGVSRGIKFEDLCHRSDEHIRAFLTRQSSQKQYDWRLASHVARCVQRGLVKPASCDAIHICPDIDDPRNTFSQTVLLG